MRAADQPVAKGTDMNFLMWRSLLAWLPKAVIGITALATVTPAYPGVFMLAEKLADRIGPNVITHPTGYRGAGRTLFVTVGIASSTSDVIKMWVPVLNAIKTWNDLVPTLGNVHKAGSNVPPGQFDFESVLLHELGHCIGLDHPNLASESGLQGVQRGYTKTTRGADGEYNLDPGMDGVIGSQEDLRGDDVNLHWFRRDNNNPFTIAPRVDRTTYGRELFDLPPGHLFAANANLGVANLLGLGNSEAVMQQGISSGDARRTLSPDDVATLRLAMSGFDGLEGTADDYTVVLEFAGWTDDADIVLRFDNEETTFAACEIQALESRPGHFVITQGNIFFRDDVAWFFNPEQAGDPPRPEIFANRLSGSATVSQREHLMLEVSLLPNASLNKSADYWVRAVTPMGVFWLNERFEFVRSDQAVRVYGGPLVFIDRLPILNSSASGLPLGEYRVTFAVDNNEDGLLDGSFQDSVEIVIVP